MSKYLEALRARREEQDRGFTLIELLVVVVIIGILVGIAIPLYLNYRKGAENKSAQSDVRGAISAVEQYYTSNGNTLPADAKSASAGSGFTLAGTNAQNVVVSANNTVAYVKGTGTNAGSYKLCGRNDNGGNWFLYDSSTGGTVVDKGKVGALPASCAG